MGIAGACIWALLKTRGEDDDAAPAKVGAMLLGEAVLRLRKMTTMKIDV